MAQRDALGMAITTAAGLVLRWFFVHRLIGGGAQLALEAARAAVPTALGAGVVLLLVQNVAVYVAVVAAATWLLQGPLLREVAGYLAGRREALVAAG